MDTKPEVPGVALDSLGCKLNQAEIELLETDEFTWEKVARERYGMVKEGEIVLRFDDVE